MKESPFDQIPTAERIAANGSAFAIWDRFPVTPGHALVISNRLISVWWEASDEEQVDLLHLLREVRLLIEEKYEPDGFNIGINVGEAAGQTINHLHLHLIPRYSGDVSDPRGGVRHVIPSKGNYFND
jgi:diadenosine tetraphosphate (Ap4A) HIT family hydrolase